MEEVMNSRYMNDKDVISNSTSSRRNSSESNVSQDSANLKNLINESSDEENVPKKSVLKRIKQFSDSDSDSSVGKAQNGHLSGSDNSNSQQSFKPSLEVENDDNRISFVPNSIPFKSRIQNSSSTRKLSSSDDSDSCNAIKNKEQLRIKNKRNVLKTKFKSLVSSREKEPPQATIQNDVNKKSDNESCSESDDEMASIEKIKQKIKERMSFKPSICDPDTSDEENAQLKSVYKPKKERKMTKPTSPKPQRISAKQAMENMQKIKSESNRMLREKEVSLPYHRPKALSLKDIMSRRKIAVSSDGKVLPIKMNEQQLRQYAQMLEERQKEMMELCKSESDEDDTHEGLAEVDKDFNEVNDPDETCSAEKVNDDTCSTNKKNDDTVSGTENINDYISEKNIENAEERSTTEEDQLATEQDSETSMQLVYNDSANSLIDENLTELAEPASPIVDSINSETAKNNDHKTAPMSEDINDNESKDNYIDKVKSNTEVESQLISLHFDTENTNSLDNAKISCATIDKADVSENNLDEVKIDGNEAMEVDNEFSDDELNMADIDNIIENAEIIKDIEDKVNSQFIVRNKPLNLNPKLTGSPGMVIDLDDSDVAPKKSGVELLKERFTYFSKLKTPEEMERDREKNLKPGTQLKKLKLELEEKIAEQRAIEWAKRFEEEKQQHKELKELRGEESEEDDLDKIEAAIEGKEEIREESEKSESEEEEPIEDDIVIKDKPRVKNAMLDDEAEESDCEENEVGCESENGNQQNDEDDGIDTVKDDDDESESDESSSEDEEPTALKKGRILKAFEDSDEEDAVKTNNQPVIELKEVKQTDKTKSGSSVIEKSLEIQIISQDDELQLAQRLKSTSDDLFTSQESDLLASEAKEQTKDVIENDEVFTQTFSILDSSRKVTEEFELNCSDKSIVDGTTQSLDVNLDEAASLFPVTDSQNILPSQIALPKTQLSQSQAIGEDVLALCTGKFYDNPFVSQVDNNEVPQDSVNYDAFENYCPSQDSQEEDCGKSKTVVPSEEIVKEKDLNTSNLDVTDNFIELNVTNKDNKNDKVVDDNLKSILDELADPEFDSPLPNKYFVGSKSTQKEVQVKKKYIIDSEDENEEANDTKKLKKLKKKRPEKRALQISDDEDEVEMLDQEEVEEYESEIEEDNPERLVEYDSEENEIEVKSHNPKKKGKTAEFFENEAELTSEDEWMGSGDEDEAGLDRMEREEGDDVTFHQGKLQRELGQIHMRDVLDQDKREVRLIQELLFEDGDLGGGGRQRKFRWNNIDGDEEMGTVPYDLADTQEDEFESEEQWRKQRHERETFLRQMQNKDDPDETLNISVNRTTIIKANLLSKTMSTLLMEVNESTSEKTETPVVEKKTKDIPSPKKPFALLQQSYQGSLLSRGRGALARLAALATPLAADDDAKVGTIGPSSRRNFVFAAITPEENAPKVTKRKAESSPATARLIKKMKADEKQNTSKSSLLDHFKL